MARRDFRRGAVAIRKARLTTWLQFLPVETTISSGSFVALIFSLNAAALALRPFTIVRTHVHLWLRSDQSAAVEVQTNAFGMAVVSDQAVAVGVSAVPTPNVEAASNLWFIHRWISGDESDVATQTRGGQFMQIDSKAMRKVEVGMDVAVVVEGGGVGSGSILGVAARMLIKNN